MNHWQRYPVDNNTYCFNCGCETVALRVFDGYDVTTGEEIFLDTRTCPHSDISGTTCLPPIGRTVGPKWCQRR